MTQATVQLVASQVPERLSRRLEALGVTLILTGQDGRVTTQGPCRWLERLVAESPILAASIKTLAGTLAQNAGELVAVWPGVWLVPLPPPRRRRVAANDSRSQPQLAAALLIGSEFLASDQIRLICDTAKLDFQATTAKVDRATLIEPAEAARLAAALAWLHQDAIEIDRRFGELQSMSTQLAESYEELSLLYKLSTSMTLNQPPAQFLTDACSELRQVVSLRWMGLQLTDDEPRLNDLAGRAFLAGDIACDPAVLKRVAAGLLPLLPEGFKPLIVDDTTTLGIPELPALARELLVVPMLRENKPFGLLLGGDKLGESHLSSIDSKLCSSLASGLSIFLENRMLFDDMAAMFMGILHALTSSIDAKDRYTKGHSERVAMLSRRLAEAAGLDPQAVERVYISGLVHDVGKIGVPEAVLTNPGKLTEDEFRLIKLHPEIGARILRDIRQMHDLIPGVLYHHERWDGKGYPTGTAGPDIPLFGRLICLADSFDAMSSTRTYRKRLELPQVLAEIRRCAGSQFDPDLAKIFVNLDFTDFFKMLQEHQDQSEPIDAAAKAIQVKA